MTYFPLRRAALQWNKHSYKQFIRFSKYMHNFISMRQLHLLTFLLGSLEVPVKTFTK